MASGIGVCLLVSPMVVQRQLECTTLHMSMGKVLMIGGGKRTYADMLGAVGQGSFRDVHRCR